MSPLVSVLLPCRNVEGVLGDAVASLRTQTFEDFEVIAVDDGSTDATWSRLQAWAAEDRRVRPLRNGGSGLVAALSTAQAYARAPLVARMDADDVAEPDRFQAQVDLFQQSDQLAACGTHVRYFPRTAVGTGARRYESWLNSLCSAESVRRDVFVECPVAHPTLMLRRSALMGVGGYRDMGWAEDYDLILRLWWTGRAIAVVPRVLLHWRESSSRASRVEGRYSPAAFRRCKVHYLARTLVFGWDGIVVWGAGSVGKAFARELLVQGLRLRAFVDLDPRKIGQEIHGVRVIEPEGIDRFRGAFTVAAVGSPGARADIRATLDAHGWREGTDYCAVA